MPGPWRLQWGPQGAARASSTANALARSAVSSTLGVEYWRLTQSVVRFVLLPKLDVAGSSPVARSLQINDLQRRRNLKFRRRCHWCPRRCPPRSQPGPFRSARVLHRGALRTMREVPRELCSRPIATRGGPPPSPLLTARPGGPVIRVLACRRASSPATELVEHSAVARVVRRGVSGDTTQSVPPATDDRCDAGRHF